MNPGTRCALIAAFLLLLLGCACSKTHPLPGKALRGEVVGPGSAPGSLLVHHEEIPGYMPAMTMEFEIIGADAASFKEGQRIRGRLLEAGEGRFQLESIELVDTLAEVALEGGVRRLEQAAKAGRGGLLATGEAAPQFVLRDQDGRVLESDTLKGRVVVLNFIYTRCPVAEMCPLSTARMAELQLAARTAGVVDLELISISLDPEYDTPPVLASYAKARGIDTSNFRFLTGPESAVRILLRNFGVISVPDEKLWQHSVATVLIGRDGRILRRIPSNDWKPSEVLPLIQAEKTGK